MADSKAYCSGNQLLTTGTSGSASFSFGVGSLDAVLSRKTPSIFGLGLPANFLPHTKHRAISLGLLSLVIPDAIDLEAIITADDFLEIGTVVAVPDFAVDIR